MALHRRFVDEIHARLLVRFGSKWLNLWAGVPERIGYLGEMRLGLLTQRLPNPPEGTRPPMVDFYSALSGESDVAQDRPALRLVHQARWILHRCWLCTRGHA